MPTKRPKDPSTRLDQIGDTLSQLLQQQTDTLISDDTPLSEEAVFAAIRFIEAIQHGGMTEEEFMHNCSSDWRILRHELDPNFPAEEKVTPHTLPEPRKRSRLL